MTCRDCARVFGNPPRVFTIPLTVVEDIGELVYLAIDEAAARLALADRESAASWLWIARRVGSAIRLERGEVRRQWGRVRR